MEICKIPRTEANFLLGTSQIRSNVGNNCKKQPKFNNLMQQNINEKD